MRTVYLLLPLVLLTLAEEEIIVAEDEKATESGEAKGEKAEKTRDAREIIVTEDEEALLTPDQLDAQDDAFRSTLQNGPISQTITELGGRPILSQAFDLGKAQPNEPYRIVRRERLRLPTYVHDAVGGITPQPLPQAPYYPQPPPPHLYAAPPHTYALPYQPFPQPYPAGPFAPLPYPQAALPYPQQVLPYPAPAVTAAPTAPNNLLFIVGPNQKH